MHVESGEDADHQHLEHEEGDHVLGDALADSPAGGDAQRHQKGGQQHEQDADPVHAHVVAEAGEQRDLLAELEAGAVRIKLTTSSAVRASVVSVVANAIHLAAPRSRRRRAGPACAAAGSPPPYQRREGGEG
jgi:hypothetical protein